MTASHTPHPTARQIRRWQRYLANERAEAAVYRELARGKTGEERDILLGLAAAEDRHEAYWRRMLGDSVGMPRRPDFSTLVMGFLARRFGSVFTLALMQSAESRTPYARDEDASEQLTADERIHAEVVRGLAARGREKMSGNFRAAVFGANDGLVSNLALVLGMAGSGVSTQVVLMTGVAGLLAGALSMAAGEYISVASQHDLLQASAPHPEADRLVPRLDVDANELALVYRARGMEPAAAAARAEQVLAAFDHPARSRELSPEAVALGQAPISSTYGSSAQEDAGGSALGAAVASFTFFASGALLPLIPFLFGAAMPLAVLLAALIVGVALMCTGGIVGILSGTSPWWRAVRQLAIGLGAAGITYAVGTLLRVGVAG